MFILENYAFSIKKNIVQIKNKKDSTINYIFSKTLGRVFIMFNF